MESAKNDLHNTVNKSLAEFVKEHIPSASLECVDDIVLNYVVSILEDLGEDEDTFDVEGFTEMLAAYIPEFGEVRAEQVCDWIFRLVAQLAQKRQEGQAADGRCDPVALLASQMETAARLRQPSTSSSDPSEKPACRRSPRISETSDPGSEASDAAPEEWQDEMSLLADMFPHSCGLELRHCLAMAGGQVEQAAQLLLVRQENGEALTPAQAASRRRDRQQLDDKSLKANIIAKYSYQDVEDVKREHKPHLPKASPKKLVRYLDNKVVSLKGERFTEIKRSTEPAPADVKKTYVSIKPLKQYRFH